MQHKECRWSDSEATYADVMKDAQAIIDLRPDWGLGYIRYVMAGWNTGSVPPRKIAELLQKALACSPPEPLVSHAGGMYMQMLAQVTDVWGASEAHFKSIVDDAKEFIEDGECTDRILSRDEFQARLLIAEDKPIDAQILLQGTWAIAGLKVGGFQIDFNKEIEEGDTLSGGYTRMGFQQCFYCK